MNSSWIKAKSALLIWFWMRLARTLEVVQTFVILTLIYFVFLFPLALLLRLVGRKSISRHYDPKAESYRVSSRGRNNLADLERMF